MVSAENRTGLYAAVPIYFAILGGCAYWAHRRIAHVPDSQKRRASVHSLTHSLSRSHSLNALQVTAHYLGERDFGWLVTAGTFFASLFSGYTVVGVPNSAFKSGFYITWWIPSLMGVVGGMFGTGLRMRRCSMERDHQSPVDFITDRFQSQFLRYTITYLQILPSLVYLSAQVIAIKGTFNSIFELDPDAVYPVIIIMMLILLFEWAGGLRSVALTDSIQAVVMIVSFVILPSVIKKNYGGWSDIDLDTYPRPEFYQTFSKEEQWNFFQLSIINFSFFSLPHLLQRNYAARDLKALKAGYVIMACGPWFTTLVGVFIGTVGVKMLGEGADPANPFSAILEEVMNLGGFAKGAGTIALTASLAAIMSTADSIIIAISQVVTMEFIKPNMPNIAPLKLTILGKLVSLGSVTVALFIGIFWDEGISDLGKIQFPLSTQTLPAFLYGLFSTSRKYEIHPWSLAIGALVASIYVFIFYFGYLNRVDEAKPVNAGISGILVNVVVVVSTELVRRAMVDEPVSNEEEGEEEEPRLLMPNRPDWDIPRIERFGEKALTPEKLTVMMNGINEPMTNWWWVTLFFLSIAITSPITPENEPPLNEDGSFVWPVSLVNGLPWWFAKLLWLSTIATVLLLVAIYNMPTEFPGFEGQKNLAAKQMTMATDDEPKELPNDDDDELEKDVADTGVSISSA